MRLGNKIINPQKIEIMATFNSFVMLASPQLSNGAFNFLGTMTGRSDKNVDNVNVIAWDCDNKFEIKPLIEKLLREAKNQEQTDTLKANIVALNSYLNEINAGTYEHDMPKGLKEAIIDQVRCSFGSTYTQDLTDGNERFMYLSSVDSSTVRQTRIGTRIFYI